MMLAMPQPLPVAVEVGRQRTFAWVIDWPGWCRSGRGEAAALASLAACASRYLKVVIAAGVEPPAGRLDEFLVEERLAGSTTTDFGAPGAIAAADHLPLPAESGRRLGELLTTSWELLEAVAGQAPAELRKGPRGGGRDRDQVVGHVLGGDFAYARRLGITLRSAVSDSAAVAELRRALFRALEAGTASAGNWPLRYYARRAAWHVLDHTWEIEDRSPFRG